MEDMQNSLNDLQREKHDMEKRRRDIICKLKDIMLDADNHIDNSFNNELKVEKKEEYKNLLKELKDIKKINFEDKKKKVNKQLEVLLDQKRKDNLNHYWVKLL